MFKSVVVERIYMIACVTEMLNVFSIVVEVCTCF